jgi:hypothetical protein
MTRSIKRNRFCSRAAKRKFDMHSNDPTCAGVYYALCTKNAKVDGIPVKWNLELF